MLACILFPNTCIVYIKCSKKKKHRYQQNEKHFRAELEITVGHGTSSDSQQEFETYSATSGEEDETILLDDWDHWVNDS